MDIPVISAFFHWRVIVMSGCTAMFVLITYARHLAIKTHLPESNAGCLSPMCDRRTTATSMLTLRRQSTINLHNPQSQRNAMQ